MCFQLNDQSKSFHILRLLPREERSAPIAGQANTNGRECQFPNNETFPTDSGAAFSFFDKLEKASNYGALPFNTNAAVPTSDCEFGLHKVAFDFSKRVMASPVMM